MYRTVLVLKNPVNIDGEQKKMISKNGTREEVEEFIFEHMENTVKTRTINKEDNKIDQELTIIN